MIKLTILNVLIYVFYVLCLHGCVSKLVRAHSLHYETSIVDKAGWKWHRAAAVQSTDPPCPVNDRHTALNPFLYTLLLWGLLAFFPLIQLVWTTIMRFRHCLLFNYRTYLSLSNMQRLPLKPLFMAQKFLHSVEIIVVQNWINMTEGVAPYEA